MRVVEEQWQSLNIRMIDRLKERFSDITDDSIKTIVNLFGEHEVVESNSDVIELGSRFNLSLVLEGYEYINDYVLSESNEPVNGYTVIQPNCPLAKAVMGLRENEEATFSVSVEDINVRVNKIYRNKIKKLQKTTK